MTTRARKAPSGARHARCTDHIAHDYPSTGYLCTDAMAVDRTPERYAEIRTFADDISRIAAEHRAAELARPAADPTVDPLYTGATFVDPAGHDMQVSPACRGKSGRYGGCAGGNVHVHASDVRPINASSADRIGLARMSGALYTRMGRPIPAAIAAVLADAGIAPSDLAEPYRAPEPEPDRSTWSNGAGSDIVGYVDNLGRLRCTACAGSDVQAGAVRRDTGPHNVEPCDSCGRRLSAIVGASVDPEPSRTYPEPSPADIAIAERRADAFLVDHPMHDRDALIGTISRAVAAFPDDAPEPEPALPVPDPAEIVGAHTAVDMARPCADCGHDAGYLTAGPSEPGYPGMVCAHCAVPYADGAPLAEPARSAGHLGYTWTIEGGVCETFARGSAIVRAPFADPIMPDGYRAGREWWPTGERYESQWRPLVWPTVDGARADMTARAMVHAPDARPDLAPGSTVSRPEPAPAPVAEPAPDTSMIGAPDAPEPAPAVLDGPEPTAGDAASRRDDDGAPDPDGTALAHDYGAPCACADCTGPEPVGAPGMVRMVYRLTAYASWSDRDAGRLAAEIVYGSRELALADRERMPYPIIAVIAEPAAEYRGPAPAMAPYADPMAEPVDGAEPWPAPDPEPDPGARLRTLDESGYVGMTQTEYTLAAHDILYPSPAASVDPEPGEYARVRHDPAIAGPLGPVDPEPAARPLGRRRTIVDYSAPMPDGFTVSDPFGALAEPSRAEPVTLPEPAADAPECPYTVGSGRPGAAHCVAGPAGHPSAHDWPSRSAERRASARARRRPSGAGTGRPSRARAGADAGPCVGCGARHDVGSRIGRRHARVYGSRPAATAAGARPSTGERSAPGESDPEPARSEPLVADKPLTARRDIVRRQSRRETAAHLANASDPLPGIDGATPSPSEPLVAAEPYGPGIAPGWAPGYEPRTIAYDQAVRSGEAQRAESAGTAARERSDPDPDARYHLTHTGPAAGLPYCERPRVDRDSYYHPAYDGLTYAAQLARPDLCAECRAVADGTAELAPDLAPIPSRIPSRILDTLAPSSAPDAPAFVSSNGPAIAATDRSAPDAATAETGPSEPLVASETSAPEPAPVLSIVPPMVDGRPTCPRCGQAFRPTGTGLAWHLANRPNCAAETRRAATA